MPDSQLKPAGLAFLGLFFLLAGAPKSWAQLNNRAFYRPIDLRPEYDQQLRLQVSALLFNKDNEYFNKIDDGLTYYGAQLAPRLIYFPSPKFRLEAGVFLQKNYGTDKLRIVQPLFTAIYQHGPHRLLLGNIQGHVQHGYIEPLFDFERVLTNPLEEGTQYLLTTRRLTLDAWVNWQRQQYRFSNYQEEVAGGLATEATVLQDSLGWRVGIPFQFTGKHLGGQIDTLDKPLQTYFNLATGLRVRKKLPSDLFRAVSFDGYLTQFIDYSFTQELAFDKGYGIYLNAGLNTKLSDLQVAYWRGNGYFSPLGGRLYRSISSTVSDPQYTERHRELLILRVLKDYQLADNIVLTTRFEPLYDLGNKSIDFSFALYLNFNQEFLLTTLKRNN
ncbi:hypothetical protein [Hymenobacter cellulosivorans]|uniref:Uncharacterized protein n=1 Tax=Hymenobacter cellulosivorans TaxID=2932249 RepID=A0ABY4F9A9_9BACT|nr:hypothetical protein [Hymenobacter cellulosivorans]UOQ53245.1 hypothetical protein MUN80_00440 [Hymenobacter cellulosivorans]